MEKKRRGCGQCVLTSVAGTGSTTVWGSALVVPFSFEMVGPCGCFCDGSRVYLFPGSANKHMKRLKCACRTKKAPGLGRKCSQTKGSGSAWILGVGPSHRCMRCIFWILILFHCSNNPTVLLSPSTAVNHPLEVNAPLQTKSSIRK